MMTDQIIDIPGVGQVAFPSSMSDMDVSKAAQRLHADAAAKGARQQEADIYREAGVGKASPSMLSLAGTAVGQGLKDLVTAPVAMAKSVGSAAMEGAPGGIPGMLGNVVKRLVLDPAMAQGSKAIDAVKQGRFVEAGGHGLAALVPMVGPASADIGEKLGTGDPETMARGVGDLGAMAAAPSAMRLTGRMATGVGNALKSGGRSAYLRAAKIPDAITKRTTTYQKTGGDIAAGQEEIANTVLSRNAGAITGRNVAGLAKAKRAASQQIGTLANDPNVAIPTAQIKGALMDELQQMAREADPSMTTAMNRAIELDSTMGPTIAASDLQPMVVGAGTRNAGKFSQLQQGAGTSRMDLAFRKAARSEQDAAIPGLKQANAEFSRLKPAVEAQAKARQRIAKHDPISLTQAGVGGIGSGIGFLAGGPTGAAVVPATLALLSFLQRGGPLSRIAQALYNTGGKAQGAGAALSAADQAALLAQLQQQAQPEQ